MGNEDLELIRGPGEGRRRYLDFLGAQVDPDYRRSWSRYRRALRQGSGMIDRLQSHSPRPRVKDGKSTRPCC